MRKDTRLSPLFRTASNGKLGGAWERGYSVTVQTKGEEAKYRLTKNPQIGSSHVNKKNKELSRD